MSKRAFTDKHAMPSKDSVEEVLSGSFRYYEEIMDIAKNFETKWTFYKGWSLKVFDKKKALFYFAPHNNSFLISMAIRETEKEKVLQMSDLSFMYKEINDALKVNEGYVIKILVEDNESAQKCKIFIENLIVLRTK